VEVGAAILVVDDDPGTRALVSGLLARVGYPVREASTGAAALAAARRERPALVILDVEMPVTSGYEVYRELRDTFGESLPVLFLSGARTEPYDRAAGLMLGADDYVVKPFDGDELLARVRRLVTHAAPPVSESASSLTPREREVLSPWRKAASNRRSRGSSSSARRP
jgi:two-component system, OmpR family, response regulator